MSSPYSGPRKRFHMECDQCHEYQKEYFMLSWETWRAGCGNNPDAILCVGCVEQNLGEQLVPSDFCWCPLNEENLTMPGQASERLVNRLGDSTHWRSSFYINSSTIEWLLGRARDFER